MSNAMPSTGLAADMLLPSAYGTDLAAAMLLLQVGYEPSADAPVEPPDSGAESNAISESSVHLVPEVRCFGFDFAYLAGAICLRKAYEMSGTVLGEAATRCLILT
eukprot:746263-Rhodomonas_salina.1